MNIADIRAAEEEARRDLTDRQAEVLAWIRSFIAENSYPPTLREVGAAFRISPSSIRDHLRALERKGAVRVDYRISRGIFLIGTPVVPVVYGTTESLCGVLDRIERRMPAIDRDAIREDLLAAIERIGPLLKRLGDS